MTQLVIDDLDDDVVAALDERAARRGLSRAEQAKRALTEGLGLLPRSTEAENAAFMEHLIKAPELADEDEWIFDRNDPRMKRPEKKAFTFDD